MIKTLPFDKLAEAERQKDRAHRRALLDVAVDIANARHYFLAGVDMVAMLAEMDRGMASFGRANAVAALKAAIARDTSRPLDSILRDASAIAAWLDNGSTGVTGAACDGQMTA